MRRRTFIGFTGMTAAIGLGGYGLVRSCGAAPENQALPASATKPIREFIARGPKTLVGLAGTKSLASPEDIQSAVRSAAEAATNFSWLSKGDAVFIKPVINSGNAYPATTSPMGVAAMIRLLKEKGAGRVIVGDMSGIEHVKLSLGKMKGSSRALAVSSGIAEAVETAGGELHFPEEAGWNGFFEDGPPDGSNWKAGLTMPNILREVDHIVLMPRCGRHALAGATLGLKAAVGYWRTDSRLEYHRDASTFQEKTAEANFIPTLMSKQRLVLTVADKILTTYGPDKGHVVTPETGLVFASESVIAHDMVSLTWLLENRLVTPDDHKKGPRDPYTSQLIVAWANRGVTYLLGGLSEAARAEVLIRHDIASIWDDRVLRRAFELSGGIQQLDLKQNGGIIPAPLMQRLTEKTSMRI